MKTFKTWTVHFVPARFIATSITALDMITNLCLVLLLLFAVSLVPKFHLNQQKKATEKSGKWSDIVQFGR